MPSASTHTSSSSLRRSSRRRAAASPPCKHSPFEIFDFIILVLVFLCSGFLIYVVVAHIIKCIIYVLPPNFFQSILSSLLVSFLESPIFYSACILCFLAAAAAGVAVAVEISSSGDRRPQSWFGWSQRCCNPKCKGLKKAIEFDVRLQTEDCIANKAATGTMSDDDDADDQENWKKIDDLPWNLQGKTLNYEYLRRELGKIAPPNGRAVLLCRARCGCPLAKLEAWGPKRGRRRRKMGTTALALEGGDCQ